MKRIIFFLLLVLFIPSYAYAQESASVNYDKCEYDKIYTNVYAPFYFHIGHDPAISQTFKQIHADNPNVSPFQRAPEGALPGQATWFEFGSIANATATYEFELGLEYLTSSDVPRPILIQLFSQGVLMEDKKIFQEENIGCIAFRISVTPPPHVFTNDEIVQIAKLQFKEDILNVTKYYADKVDQNTEETRGLKMELIAVTLVVIFLIVFLAINNKTIRNQMKTQQDEYDIRNKMIATSILKLDANLKMEQFRLSKIDKDNQSMINAIVGNFGHMIEKIHDASDDIKLNVRKLIDDLRKEIDLIPIVPDEPIVTFVDMTNPNLNPKIIIPHEIKEQDKVSEKNNIVEEPIGKVLNFDLGSIKDAIAKPFENMIKKEPDLSDIDKLTIKWSEMSNEELTKIYTEYLEKATSDLHTNTYGSNYDCMMILFKIINDRTTDVSK